MNLIVSRRAVRRLVEIAAYFCTENPASALAVSNKLQTTFALIADRPYIGRPFRDQVRRFAVPRLPSVILYRVDEQGSDVNDPDGSA